MKYQFDVAILGGGSGGLVAASSLAQLGLDVLLVEKERLGGDCLWYGCVPSKALIASAKRIHAIESAKDVGISAQVKQKEFKKIIGRMRAVQAEIEPHDSPERFRRLGCTVKFGTPSFLSKHSLQIGKEEVTFKYAIIATGSSPKVPQIPGLGEYEYLTNLNLFSLKKLPARLAVIGGGPIGVEMAQAFNRFGSKVQLFGRRGILPNEDPETAGILRERLEREGIGIDSTSELVGIDTNHKRKRIILKDATGSEKKCLYDGILLIAIGRAPNILGLRLEAAGIDYSSNGIKVDASLRTTAKNIYAIGDVIGGMQFTHLAASHASTVVRNILTPIFKVAAESVVVPWVTYTDPELARIGMTSDEAKAAGIEHEVLSMQLQEVDRARCDAVQEGVIKVVVTPKGAILGATILAPHAGEMIMEYVLAMKHGLTIKDLAGTIHPYPTYASGNWTLAGKFYRKFISERTKQIARFLVRRF